MPLVYQGRLERGRLGVDEALTLGETQLAAVTGRRRLDAWLAWQDPELLAAAAALLPEDFDGFWLDVTARAEPRLLTQYLDWCGTLRGGRLGLHGLGTDRENDVTITLAGPPLLKVDDDALDPRKPHLRSSRCVVGYGEGGDQTMPPPPRRGLAAARTRAAYELLSQVVGDPLPGFEAWLLESPQPSPLDPSQVHGVMPHVPSGPWVVATPPPLPRVPGDVVLLRAAVVAGAPYGVQVHLPGDAEAQSQRLFRLWVGLLEQLDAVSLRCRGTRAQLEALLDTLDLSHHGDRPHNAFGVSTLFHAKGLAPDVVRALVTAPAIRDALLDWGLRWSELQFSLDGAEVPGDGFYFVRPERGRTFDNLTLCLDIEDAEQPAFRRARRKLASALSADLGSELAWQFEGPPLVSPRGQRYAALEAGLRRDVEAVCAAPATIATAPPRRAPPLVQWLRRLRRGRRRLHLDVPALARAALPAALPGFRHDPAAHPTDRYFVALVRATEAGFQYIELRRFHEVPGHRVRIGVSRYRMRLSDLEPGVGQAVPGLAIDLEDLVPERQPLEWRYTSRREAEAAMADTAAVLAARAGPFFELAERRLAEMAAGEEG